MSAPRTNYALIEMLADGGTHSGEELAGALGISRAAVWKRIAHLEKLGLQVTRKHSQGYQLSEPLELLSAPRIRSLLNRDGDAGNIVVLDSVDSTNQKALELLREHSCANGMAVLAEHQTAGRGRRGRAWVSPYGRNLYCSIMWRFEGGVQALAGLSLVVGIAVVRALREHFDLQLMLKWPNDVVAQNAKLGGILIEIDGDLGGPVTAVIGVGLNVRLRSDEARAVSQPCTDLASLCKEPVSRNLLAAGIIGSCNRVIAEFARQSFAQYRDEWIALDALRGKVVSAEAGGEPVVGVAAGVDDGGALLIECGGVVRRVVGGEVSVRPVG